MTLLNLGIHFITERRKAKALFKHNQSYTTELVESSLGFFWRAATYRLTPKNVHLYFFLFVEAFSR